MLPSTMMSMLGRHLSSVPPSCTSAHARHASLPITSLHRPHAPSPHCTSLPQARRLAHTAVHAKRTRKQADDDATSSSFPVLSSLNAQQLAAATDNSHAVYVKAGPGTGKTRTVAAHVEHLVGQGTHPSCILVLTHSNSAAAELKDRLTGRKFKGIHASTFHSFCATALRGRFSGISKSIEDLGTGLDRDFKIFGGEEAKDALQLALSKHPAFKKAQLNTFDRVSETLMGVVGAVKNMVKHTLGPRTDILHTIANGLANRTFPIDNMISDNNNVPYLQAYLHDPVFLTDVFGRYQSELALNNALDYDDLISFTVALLSNDIKLCTRYNSHFSHILIDEFQDANTPQLELAKLLKGDRGSLFVVGDEDQAIYSWRCYNSAKAGEKYLQEWPDAQLRFLTLNYRSGAPILKAATAVLSHGGIPQGYKPVQPLPGKTAEKQHISVDQDADSREAASIVEELLRDGQEAAEDIAILIRTKHQAGAIQSHLRLMRIPHVFLGVPSIWDDKLVKQCMRFLRLCLDPVPGTLAHIDAAGFACIHLGPAITSCTASTTSSLSHATRRKKVMTQLSEICADRDLSQNMVLFGGLLDVWIEGDPLSKALELVSAAAHNNSWHNVRGLTPKQASAAVKQQSDELQAFLAPLIPELHTADLPGMDDVARRDLNNLRRILVLARSAARAGDMQACLQVFLDGTGFRVDQANNYVKAKRLTELEGFSRRIVKQDSGTAQGLQTSNKTALPALQAFATLPDRVDGKEDTKRKGHVSILTMHKSKGMEFRNVVLSGFNDGLIPLKANEVKVAQGKRLPALLEEEARLAFVAITRAEKRMFFVGKAVGDGASPFTDALHDLEQRLPGSINFQSRTSPVQSKWPFSGGGAFFMAEEGQE